MTVLGDVDGLQITQTLTLARPLVGPYQSLASGNFRPGSAGHCHLRAGEFSSAIGRFKSLSISASRQLES